MRRLHGDEAQDDWLLQADTLNKLIPDRLRVPTPPSVLARVSLVHDGLIAALFGSFLLDPVQELIHAALLDLERHVTQL